MNKKTLLVLVSVLALLLAGGIGTGYAAVIGPCSDCHTMHQTERDETGGTGVGLTTAGDGALIKSTCLGCHTGDTGISTDGLTPFVIGSTSDYLAGGYFTTETDTNGHSTASHTLDWVGTPAGYGTGGTVGSSWYNVNDGLSCAGETGCHGDESSTTDARGIAGGHHDNNTTLGYRMLRVTESHKVAGIEDSDWEDDVIEGSGTTQATANIYSAGAPLGDSMTFGGGITGTATISHLCGKCHGDYHAESGSTMVDGGWIRHPTDEAIPTSWIIGPDTYVLNNDDLVNNPVGYISNDLTGTRYVTCLSCHRAHGSAEEDILRFDYDDQCAGSPTTTIGCLGCHDKQRVKTP